MVRKLLFVSFTCLSLMGCWFQDAGAPVPKETEVNPAERYHDRENEPLEERRDSSLL